MTESMVFEVYHRMKVVMLDEIVDGFDLKDGMMLSRLC